MMIKKKELNHILLAVILMSVVLSLFNKDITGDLQGILNYLKILFYSALIIFVSVFAKKIAAKQIFVDITHKIWHFQRYNLAKKRYLKKPFPIGVVLPIILSLISLGYIKMLAFLQYDAEALPEKAIKRRGKKTWREIMEWDLALISFYGLVGILLLSLLADLFGISPLAKYAVFYAIWNLIPISSLDGVRIFFGSRPGSIILLPLLYLLSLILTAVTLLMVLF